MRKIDRTGIRYGRLVVLEEVKNYRPKGVHWRCLCDCGNECIVSSAHLSDGHTQSCGCYHKDRTSEVSKTHGMTETPQYKVYEKIRQRINSKTSRPYHRYGGRGIKLCDEWQDFVNFKKWLDEHDWKRGLHIHRVDVDGDYCPENCVLLTRQEHMRIHAKMNSKRVAKMDLDGNVLEVFDSIAETHTRYGYSTGNICWAIKRQLKSYGFLWKYLDK